VHPAPRGLSLPIPSQEFRAALVRVSKCEKMRPEMVQGKCGKRTVCDEWHMQEYTCGVICSNDSERRKAQSYVWLTRTRSALLTAFFLLEC